MNLIGLVPPALLAAVGASLTITGLRDIFAGHASKRWPSTRARVLSIGYHPGTRYQGDTALDIRYEYLVADQRYEANRFAFSGRGTGVFIFDLGAKYAVGDLVPIYFDPQRPQVACLHPGAGLSNYLMLALGLAFLIPAIYWILITLRAS